MKRPLVLSLCLTVTTAAEDAGSMLPGEWHAERLLNGECPFPPSPVVRVIDNTAGFSPERLSKVPPPGVHPRILMSPEDLPELRDRLRHTETGRKLHALLKSRADAALRDPGNWSSLLYQKLSAGDKDGALALVAERKGYPRSIGHYQPWIYAIVLELIDAMIEDDDARGKLAATAIATHAAIIRPELETALAAPLADDVWRAGVSGPVTGSGLPERRPSDGLGGHLLGYAYDFGHGFMTPAQRDTVRGVIATATRGRVWMGVRLPAHFRNWNWIAVGLQQPLLALAIEGEEGYDPRVYQMGVRIARDYLTYGISAAGESTESIGYTQFGLIWGNPFFVAASRRGDNLLVHGHHRATLDWYVRSMEPTLDRFTSHGDGGDVPPSVWTLAMWRRFFPGDARADFLWQCFITRWMDRIADFHLIEPLLWVEDPLRDENGGLTDYDRGAKLGLSPVRIDPARGSLSARSGWHEDACTVSFECRVDSMGASHEHADRGNFTLFSHGRSWAKENFRSVETRHHNCVLIDGKGQGFWPGPGKWLGHREIDGILTASVDAKDSYDWWWPKQILSEPADFIRFRHRRWMSYAHDAAEFRRIHGNAPLQRDKRPAVVSFWEGYDATGPRLWDEDGWPVRLPHNPVRRAVRSIAFCRGLQPWLLVTDTIQKDDRERLYEWLMQTGPDTELVSASGNELILGDASVRRNAKGLPAPREGDRLLLIRVLDAALPADPREFPARPSFRLEAFERKDTLVPQAREGALTGSRSFGLDKRLVIASRAVRPDFKVFLFPHRAGDPLPETSWNPETRRIEVRTRSATRGVSLSEEGILIPDRASP